MALVEPGMLCSLCHEPIADPGVNTFSTSMHAKLYVHETFGRLNDTAVHQQCIDS